MMGRAADNERIKLEAAFYNNIGIGLFVAGAVVPYFAIWRPISDFFYALATGIRPLPPPTEESSILFPTIGIALTAFVLALAFRFVADRKIKRLQG